MQNLESSFIKIVFGLLLRRAEQWTTSCNRMSTREWLRATKKDLNMAGGRKDAVATELAPQFIWQGALVMGAVIGLIELFFVHADERGLGWLSHGLHALPVAMMFTFFAMNVDFFLHLVGINLQATSIYIEAGVRVVLGLVAAFKVKSAAAVIQGHNAVGEKLGHALIIGALIAASPYIWAYAAPLLPYWLTGLPLPTD